MDSHGGPITSNSSVGVYSSGLYNSLPSLLEANEVLHKIVGNVDAFMLSTLAPIFKDHQDFGVCLVHRHHKLNQGERMVSFQRVSKPECTNDLKSFPEKWLSDGTPYEFKSTHTKKLPQSLQEKFHKALKGHGTHDGRNLTEVLGIFHEFHFHSDHDRCESIEEVTAKLNLVSVETNNDSTRASVQDLEERETALKRYKDIKTAWCFIFIRTGPGLFDGPFFLASCQ